MRTRKLHTAAATALRAIGSPEALEVLEVAAATGKRSVRTAARAALRNQPPARPAPESAEGSTDQPTDPPGADSDASPTERSAS